MLKYAETPRGHWLEERRRMHKEKGPSRQKEEARSLSAVTWGVTTSKSPLLLVEGHVAAQKRTTLANLSPVAAVSVNSMPQYKKYQNGLIELPSKTLDLDKLPKATNTLLKL